MTDIISKRVAGSSAPQGGRADVALEQRFVGGSRPEALELAPTDAASAPIDQAGLVEIVELMFFAYRDFTGEADAALSELGFGRAHHRVLHFVHRHPGLRVADLLDVLKITKQSLARVLKQLVDDGYIEQSAGTADRRERRLSTTDRGSALAAGLDAIQAARVRRALQAAGTGAAASGLGDGAGPGLAAAGGAESLQAVAADVRGFLMAMIAEPDQARVADLVAASRARAADPKRRQGP